MNACLLFYSDSPTESHVDFQFYGYCGDKPVSRIKFMQIVFILNQYPLNPGFPSNLFNAPVASPKLTEIGSQHNKTVTFSACQRNKNVQIIRPIFNNIAHEFDFSERKQCGPCSNSSVSTVFVNVFINVQNN